MLANEYFKSFLEELGCTDISFSDCYPNKQMIGFNCASRELIDELFKTLKLPARYYKENDHYISFITTQQLFNLMQTHFNTILKQLENHFSATFLGKFENSESFIFESAENYLNVTRNDSLCEALQTKGIHYHETNNKKCISTIFSYHTHSLPPLSTHCTAVYTPDSVLEPWRIYSEFVRYQDNFRRFLSIHSVKNFFEAYGKNITTKLLEQQPKKVFLQGLHSKSKNSSLQTLRKNSLYEPKLLPSIFSYVGKMQPTFFESSEQKRISDTIPVIESAISRLQQESRTCYFFVSRKLKKITFLKCILQIKKANSLLSNKTCVEIAIKQHPNLYKEAIKGCFSQRTFRLIEDIRYPKERVPILKI